MKKITILPIIAMALMATNASANKASDAAKAATRAKRAIEAPKPGAVTAPGMSQQPGNVLKAIGAAAGVNAIGKTATSGKSLGLACENEGVSSAGQTALAEAVAIKLMKPDDACLAKSSDEIKKRVVAITSAGVEEAKRMGLNDLGAVADMEQASGVRDVMEKALAGEVGLDEAEAEARMGATGQEGTICGNGCYWNGAICNSGVAQAAAGH